VTAHQVFHRIATMTRVLGVSPSGCYAWRRRPLSGRAQADVELSAQIAAIHRASRGTLWGSAGARGAGGPRASRRRHVGRSTRAAPRGAGGQSAPVAPDHAQGPGPAAGRPSATIPPPCLASRRFLGQGGVLPGLIPGTIASIVVSPDSAVRLAVAVSRRSPRSPCASPTGVVVGRCRPRRSRSRRGFSQRKTTRYWSGLRHVEGRDDRPFFGLEAERDLRYTVCSHRASSRRGVELSRYRFYSTCARLGGFSFSFFENFPG
jgi:hypothetical protein